MYPRQRRTDVILAKRWTAHALCKLCEVALLPLRFDEGCVGDKIARRRDRASLLSAIDNMLSLDDGDTLMALTRRTIQNPKPAT